MKPFWCVASDDGGLEKARWPCLDAALNHAGRLATLRPGVRYYVLAVVTACYQPPSPALVWENIQVPPSTPEPAR